MNPSRLLRTIPPSVRRLARRIYRRLAVSKTIDDCETPQEVFDLIYTKGFWGLDVEGRPTSGGGSHDTVVTAPYVREVTSLLRAEGLRVAVDLGCGDFAVGRQISPAVDRYVACDISEVILARNRHTFNLPNVEFKRLDLSSDPLPAGDIAFVRQVLQHLPNSMIAMFLDNLRATGTYRFLLVTEHLPADPAFVANLDKPLDFGIRIHQNSGVELHQPPFNLEALAQRVLLEVDHPADGVMGHIRSTLYTLR